MAAVKIAAIVILQLSLVTGSFRRRLPANLRQPVCRFVDGYTRLQHIQSATTGKTASAKKPV
jgi:hypothetical protein